MKTIFGALTKNRRQNFKNFSKTNNFANIITHN